MPTITFTEPVFSRYIYINPSNNNVHLLMPVNSGTEIGLDNTCKSVYALQEFFGKSPKKDQASALKELSGYKDALEFDISLIREENDLKNQKTQRLLQIKHHINMLGHLEKTDALKGLASGFPIYPTALQHLMEHKDSNLYSMVLRPMQNPDDMLRAKRVIFSVKRNEPSTLHTAIVTAYSKCSIPLSTTTSRQRLIKAIIASQPKPDTDFLGLQKLISEKIKTLFKQEVNTFENQERPITKEFIEKSLNFSDNIIAIEDYINAILYYCAPKLFDRTTDSPFYTAIDIEQLSLVTQFFLAQVNIFCVANSLSSSNFAAILDASDNLSIEMMNKVIAAQTHSVTIETTLFEFINQHRDSFKLLRELTQEEHAHITQQFTNQYQDIKDAPHFDEFSVIDINKPGKFVVHQGSICISFSEFLAAEGISHFLTSKLCSDFSTMKGKIPHKNDHIAESININMTTFSDHELAAILEKIPPTSQLALSQEDPERIAKIKQLKLIPEFLQDVAHGKEEQAKQILLRVSIPQSFLLATHPFTDYSYRTFNCTAYEYAYWAKDTKMCHMLEEMMDKDTKLKMYERVQAIDQKGLSYEQYGKTISSSKEANWDSLKDALAAWITQFSNWSDAKMTELWLVVGKAQREVPAHVAQEYCRRDRDFSSIPKFNETCLPRELSYYHFKKNIEKTWFPLDEEESAKLGHSLGFIRGGRYRVGGTHLPDKLWALSSVKGDLAAMIHLDQVRREERTQLRQNLLTSNPTSSMCISV